MMGKAPDPFALPDGNVQVAVSGGRSSAYMLHEILRANGPLPDRVQVTFQNTGREMPQTLDFVAEMARRWDVKIRWLEYRPSTTTAHPFSRPRVAEAYADVFGNARFDHMNAWWAERATDNRFERVGHNSASLNGEPFEALVMHRMYLPNVRARFCTIELKVRTAKRYLRSLGWDHWTNVIGFRADEPARVNKPPPRDRWTVWTPMVHAGVTRQAVEDFWKSQPFDLQLPNIGGACWLGNCDDCFLKSEANLSAFARDLSDRHAWWEGWERWIGAIWPLLTPYQRLRRIIRSNPDLPAQLREAYGRPVRPSVIAMIVDQPQSAGRFSKRYARMDLRDFMERQGDWALTTEGVLCRAGDGECVV